MSHRQTRKSISVSGELYDRLKLEVEPTSGIVERVMRKHLGMEPRSIAKQRKYNLGRPRKSEPADTPKTTTTTRVGAGINPTVKIPEGPPIPPCGRGRAKDKAFSEAMASIPPAVKLPKAKLTLKPEAFVQPMTEDGLPAAAVVPKFVPKLKENRPPPELPEVADGLNDGKDIFTF